MTTTKHLHPDMNPESQGIDPRQLTESEAIKYTEHMADGGEDGTAAASAFARANRTLPQIIDRTKYRVEKLGQDARRANDVVRTYVRDNPVQSLLVAAGGGFVIAGAIRLLGARLAP